MGSRKVFILDTSVLLYDKTSIHSFPENDVVIPLVVLDELDRFKEKHGILGENARYVNRFLDDLRKDGNLNKGIKLENGQTVRVETSKSENIPSDLNRDAGDNIIIGVVRFLKSRNVKKKVVVVTKDINFRVKCDALNINSEDYYKDRIVTSSDKLYQGWRSLEVQDPEIFDKFYSDSKISADLVCEDLKQNEFIIAKSGNQSLLGVRRGDNVEQVISNLHDMIPIKPRNKEQKFALDLLTRDDISLVTITGRAGSGKTFLTLLSAISGIQRKQYKRIIITRSLQPVGRDIGYLPGDLNSKLDPWIGSIIDNFQHHFDDLTYFHMMRDKGIIEVAPLAMMRGRTFNNSFIIVDEAQNSTIHELKTIITRVGEDSKIVLLGDIEQIDTPYIDTTSNGLTIVAEKLRDEKISGHVTLIKGERSELATLASKLI